MIVHSGQELHSSRRRISCFFAPHATLAKTPDLDLAMIGGRFVGELGVGRRFTVRFWIRQGSRSIMARQTGKSAWRAQGPLSGRRSHRILRIACGTLGFAAGRMPPLPPHTTHRVLFGDVGAAPRRRRRHRRSNTHLKPSQSRAEQHARIAAERLQALWHRCMRAASEQVRGRARERA